MDLYCRGLNLNVGPPLCVFVHNTKDKLCLVSAVYTVKPLHIEFLPCQMVKVWVTMPVQQFVVQNNCLTLRIQLNRKDKMLLLLDQTLRASQLEKEGGIDLILFEVLIVAVLGSLVFFFL